MPGEGAGRHSGRSCPSTSSGRLAPSPAWSENGRSPGRVSLGFVEWLGLVELRGVWEGAAAEAGLDVGLGVVGAGLDGGAGGGAVFLVEEVADGGLGEVVALHDAV